MRFIMWIFWMVVSIGGAICFLASLFVPDQPKFLSAILFFGTVFSICNFIALIEDNFK